MHGLHDYFNVCYKPLYCSGRHHVASIEAYTMAICVEQWVHTFFANKGYCIEQWVHTFFANKVVSTIWKVWQPGERVLRYIQDRGPQARVQSISPR